MKYLVALVAVVVAGLSVADAQPNPYCVTGLDWRANGGMAKLGMPGGLNDESGSLGYFWGVFTAYEIPAMTNPCYRWGSGGAPKHCYNVDTDTISDPAWTRSVRAIRAVGLPRS